VGLTIAAGSGLSRGIPAEKINQLSFLFHLFLAMRRHKNTSQHGWFMLFFKGTFDGGKPSYFEAVFLRIQIRIWIRLPWSPGYVDVDRA
jgi:hypothetical protein